jgi:hypothetical protein
MTCILHNISCQVILSSLHVVLTCPLQRPRFDEDQYVWYFWWTKWHWDRFFYEYVCFSTSVFSPKCSICIFHSCAINITLTYQFAVSLSKRLLPLSLTYYTPHRCKSFPQDLKLLCSQNHVKKIDSVKNHINATS